MARERRQPYPLPTAPYIGPEDGKKLYGLEENRDAIILETAHELQRILELKDYWSEAMPEALLSVLESFDVRIGMAAARAFIAKNKER